MCVCVCMCIYKYTYISVYELDYDVFGIRYVLKHVREASQIKTA